MRDATEVFTYHFARNIDLHGTDIHSDAIGNAPGGIVLMRAQGQASFTDTNISVATQDFEINANKPNGESARNQGFSRIDIMAQDIVLKDSTIAADAKVSDTWFMSHMQRRPKRRGDLVARSEFTHRRQFVHHQHEQRASPSRHHEDHQGSLLFVRGHLGTGFPRYAHQYGQTHQFRSHGRDSRPTGFRGISESEPTTSYSTIPC